MLNRVSRCFFSTAAAAQPWLFVGLGNPGEKFKGTRHNVGLEMVDAFAESLGIPMNSVICKAIFGEGFVGDAPVLLANPQTYIGESILFPSSLGRRLQERLCHLCARVYLHDDMDLPCGVLRLQPKGGHGSHNGCGYVVKCLNGCVELSGLLTCGICL